LADPTQPVLWIRYANPRRRHKERKLRLPAWWPAVLAEYRAQYQPEQALFPCTARNLEYVLRHVAEAAELANGLSFEMLRWTCSVRDYRAGMPADKLRQKLGISKITWREVGVKIAKLAGPALYGESFGLSGGWRAPGLALRTAKLLSQCFLDVEHLCLAYIGNGLDSF
jgi:hypothetical protein